jgi:uncharacterized protein YlxP (DUF503 family)
MIIGVLRITLHLPNSGSLKTKRQVVAGLLRRVRQQFQVAAAEVGDRDRWQLAELAVACVSTESGHADEILNRVVSFVERSAGDAQVSSVRTELIRL